MDEKYFKLLEDEQELKKTGEYLSLEKAKELIKYEIQILDHLRWHQKNNFIEAMVDFLQDKIDIHKYINRFYKINYQINESNRKLKSDFEKLRAFESDPHSKGSSMLIENVLSDIQILELDDELRTEDEISKESLIDGIKEFLPKIQEY